MGEPDHDPRRAGILAAAERHLVASPEHEISTRAVCEAAGVTQPVLYRLFGDKQGLLDAVADAGFERYARRKAELEQTGDPVADLYAGWDDHLAFARDNPAVYRLMFAPRPGSRAGAHRRILGLLEKSLSRCAAAGALSTTAAAAAQLILPVNVGVALSLLGQPALFDDPGLSHRARDAAFAAVLSTAPPVTTVEPVRATARHLHAQLTLDGTDRLEPVELALLVRWLERLAAPRGA